MTRPYRGRMLAWTSDREQHRAHAARRCAAGSRMRRWSPSRRVGRFPTESPSRACILASRSVAEAFPRRSPARRSGRCCSASSSTGCATSSSGGSNIGSRPDGQFGGGWGDDCEMWRWWSSVLLGFDDPKITRGAAQVLARRRSKRPHLKGGFNTEITDVEHAAEDTTDNLVPLIVLEPDEPRWTQLGAASSATSCATSGPGATSAGSFSSRASTSAPPQVRPAAAARLRCDRRCRRAASRAAALAAAPATRNSARQICAWLDTWVDATARAENGKPAGILPASIRWPDGAAAGADRTLVGARQAGRLHAQLLRLAQRHHRDDRCAACSRISMTGEGTLSRAAALHGGDPAAAFARSAAGDPGRPAAKRGAPRSSRRARTPTATRGGLVKTLARFKALTGTTRVRRTARAGRRRVRRSAPTPQAAANSRPPCAKASTRCG